MLTTYPERLIYTSENGESLIFAPNSQYYVNFKSVSGLSDVIGENSYTMGMGQDGETHLAVRIEGRDIEIAGDIRAWDRAQTQSLRRHMLRVLNPRCRGTLAYEFAGQRRIISCRAVEAPLISRGAVLDNFTVSLYCPSPFWRDELETRTDIAAWYGGLEYPLNLSAGWEIGSRQASYVHNTYNAGDVSCGMSIELRANGAVSAPKIINASNTDEYIELDITMQLGDRLTVKTGYGEKSVKLLRAGTETDAFSLLDYGSTFLQLVPGDNLIRYAANSGAANLDVTVYHNNLYLGV